MRRWVTSIQEESGVQPSYATVAAELANAYAGWAGEPMEPGEPTDRELGLIERTEERLLSAEWLHRDGFEWATAPASPVRRVKIRSGRWDSVFDWSLGNRPVRIYLSADRGDSIAGRTGSVDPVPLQRAHPGWHSRARTAPPCGTHR